MSLPADDLLSAFHDGELTAAERVVVEQQLTSSVEARRELSEVRQVSSLLSDLPQATLPHEFPEQVLKGIEREMLIPSERSYDGTNESTRTLISRTDSAPRRWMIGTAAVLTSAAGLLLLVPSFSDRPKIGSSRSVGYSDGSDVTQTQAASGLAGSSPKLTELNRAGEGAGPSAVADATGANGDADLLDRTSTQKLGAAVAMKETISPLSTSLRAPRRTDGAANYFLDQATLKTAEIGEVVNALQTDGDEIAVVRLTVIDRHEGLNQLQLLLSDHQIVSETAATSQDKSKDELSKRDAATSPDQIMAIFVESDSQHLTSALQDLSQTTHFQSLEVEPPISLAELDTPSDKPLAKSDKSLTRESKSPAETFNALQNQRGFAETLNQARQSQNIRGESVTRSQDRKSGDKSSNFAKKSAANAKDVPALTSRQMTLQVPVDALPPPQGGQNQALRNRENVGQRSQNQAKQNFDSQNEQRPMQVLFVVVNQAGNAGKQNESPAAAKPTAPAKAKAKESKSQKDGGAA